MSEKCYMCGKTQEESQNDSTMRMGISGFGYKCSKCDHWYCSNCSKEFTKMPSGGGYFDTFCPVCDKGLKPQNVKTQNVEPQNVSQQKSGCFIATAVYGDFNDPTVYVFRNYRDNILSKSYLGKIFIKIYYFISPPVAEIIKNTPFLKNVFKYLLDYLKRFLI